MIEWHKQPKDNVKEGKQSKLEQHLATTGRHTSIQNMERSEQNTTFSLHRILTMRTQENERNSFFIFVRRK